MDKTLRNKSNLYRNGKIWLLIALFCILSEAFSQENSGTRVLFVGDILLSRNVKQELLSRGTSPWDSLKLLFQTANFIIGNLEGAVGDNQNQINPINKSPVFAVDSSYIPLLNDAGFNIITIENNHILDLGEEGKRNTISSLLNNNIKPINFDNSPYFFSINDIVLSLLTLNIVTNRDNSKNQVPSIELKQKLRLARTLADIVIVSIHWGSELLEWPNSEQREVAKWLIEKGTDIIIGSHSHVIQNPEIIEGKPVFFSLGNHLFDQKYPITKEGLIVEIYIKDGVYRCNGIKTRTRKNSFYPEIKENIDFKFSLITYKHNYLRIHDYNIKPLSIVDINGNKTILQAFDDNVNVWNTRPISLISIGTSKLDGENEFLFTLEKHYSSLDNEINVRPYVYSIDEKGIYARWRGSALAWPLIDAQFSPYDKEILCALHRGDSFINLDKTKNNNRIAAYKWNGFGFTGLSDSIVCEYCNTLFK